MSLSLDGGVLIHHLLHMSGFFRWPETKLSDESRKQRRAVLATSCIVIASQIWNLVPSEIPALGIKNIDQTVPIDLLFFIVHLYFFLDYMVRSGGDVVHTWHRVLKAEENPLIEKGPKAVVFFAKYVFDFWLPWLLGLAAIIVFILV